MECGKKQYEEQIHSCTDKKHGDMDRNQSDELITVQTRFGMGPILPGFGASWLNEVGILRTSSGKRKYCWGNLQSEGDHYSKSWLCYFIFYKPILHILLFFYWQWILYKANLQFRLHLYKSFIYKKSTSLFIQQCCQHFCIKN